MKNKWRYNAIKKLVTFDEFEKTKLSIDKIVPQRRNIRILLIDDEANFIPDALKRIDYINVTHIKDFTKTDDLENYQVILCDIHNIGTDLHKDQQGLAVYKQIKKIYPYKIVALYSAHNPNDFGHVTSDDIVINKPVEPTELANKIDKITERFWQPKTAWKYIETESINKQLNHREIAIIEDMFVRSFLNNQNNQFEFYKKNVAYSDRILELISLGSDIISILLKIAPNFIQK
jgi:DNA-binding NarL/FixJ family response regulator